MVIYLVILKIAFISKTRDLNRYDVLPKYNTSSMVKVVA